MYPCVEIIKEVDHKVRQPKEGSGKPQKPEKTFEESYLPLIERIKSKNVFIDLPIQLKQNDDMNEDSLLFLRTVVTVRDKRTEYMLNGKSGTYAITVPCPASAPNCTRTLAWPRPSVTTLVLRFPGSQLVRTASHTRRNPDGSSGDPPPTYCPANATTTPVSRFELPRASTTRSCVTTASTVSETSAPLRMVAPDVFVPGARLSWHAASSARRLSNGILVNDLRI